MHRSIGGGSALVAAVGCLVIAAGVASAPVPAQDPQPRHAGSLDTGVYAASQATRGKAHFAAFCATCHAADLSGSLAADTGAPPLRGVPFLASLERTGLASFFAYVKETMPADDPSTLRDAEYLDILAYLLQANGFPVGPGDLTLESLPRAQHDVR